MHLFLVRKIVFRFHPAKFENFKTEKFLDQKSVLVAQRQSLLVRNYFQFLVQQRFSNSYLRQISDYGLRGVWCQECTWHHSAGSINSSQL